MNNVVSTTNLRLNRYAAVIAHIPPTGRKFKGVKKAEATEIQQKALDSWLACSSKVILVNMASDVAHLNTKGVTFEEKHAANPTILTLLAILGKSVSGDSFGVVVDDWTILDPAGPAIVSSVRLRAQLSRAWACTAMLDVWSHGDGSRVIGSDAWAFWISGQVASYMATACKNPPMAGTGQEWVSWLATELKEKVLGHRYFDATDLGLAKFIAPEEPYIKQSGDPISLPFTRHA